MHVKLGEGKKEGKQWDSVRGKEGGENWGLSLILHSESRDVQISPCTATVRLVANRCGSK